MSKGFRIPEESAMKKFHLGLALAAMLCIPLTGCEREREVPLPEGKVEVERNPDGTVETETESSLEARTEQRIEETGRDIEATGQRVGEELEQAGKELGQDVREGVEDARRSVPDVDVDVDVKERGGEAADTPNR
jgi:hypothetical protein